MAAPLYGEELRSKISVVQLENQKDMQWRLRALQAVGPVDALVKQDLLAQDNATAYTMIEALMQGEPSLSPSCHAWRNSNLPKKSWTS